MDVGWLPKDEFLCREVRMSMTVPSEPQPSCYYFIFNSRQVSITFLIGSVALPGNIQGHSHHASTASYRCSVEINPF